MEIDREKETRESYVDEFNFPPANPQETIKRDGWTGKEWSKVFIDLYIKKKIKEKRGNLKDERFPG